jgi:serine/threonine protein phosphatase 1
LKGRKSKSKTYVIGDIHGAYLPLEDLLTKGNINKKDDKIIFIGDLADGLPDFDKCLELLLSFDNFIPIIGNHDFFLMEFLKYGTINEEWIPSGGVSTIEKLNNPHIISNLKTYFSKADYYHVHDNKIFLHGGFNPKRAIDSQRRRKFSLNRKLYSLAKTYHQQKRKIPVSFKDTGIIIDEIFIGHSTTRNFKPDFVSNLINVDTGIKCGGKLTLMDVDTKQYIQSKNTEYYYKK